MSPNLFERIYCVAVDPDDYTIDYSKTMSTTAGRKAWGEVIRANLVRKVKSRSKPTSRGRARSKSYVYKMKPRPKREGYVSIYEYFISVEVLSSEVSNRSKSAEEKMQPSTEALESYTYEPGDT